MQEDGSASLVYRVRYSMHQPTNRPTDHVPSNPREQEQPTTRATHKTIMNKLELAKAEAMAAISKLQELLMKDARGLALAQNAMTRVSCIESESESTRNNQQLTTNN